MQPAQFLAFLIFLSITRLIPFGLTGFAVAAEGADQNAASGEARMSGADNARYARHQKFLADSYFNQKREQEAAQLYVSALAMSPDAFNFNEKYHIAKRLLVADRAEEAVSLLRSLIAEKPNFIAARMDLAWALMNQAQHRDAIVEADQILRIDPDNSDGKAIKANSTRALAFDRAAKEQRPPPDVYFQNAQLGLAAKNYFKSLFLSENAFGVDEKMAVAKRLVATIKVDDLQALFRQLASEQSENENSTALLAKSYALFAQALADLGKRDASGKPNQAEIRVPYGRKSSEDIGRESVRTTQASKLYLDALALAPTAFTVNEKIRIAHWLSGAGRASDALDILAPLSAIEPDNVSARLALAKIHTITEDYAQTLVDLEPVLMADPENRDALFMRATVLRKLGRRTDAIAIYKAVAARNNDTDARLGLIYSLLAAGRRVEAASVLAGTQTEDEAQLEALAEAKSATEQSTATSLEISETRYEDSDKNTSDELRLGAKTGFSDYTVGATYRDRSTDGGEQVFSAATYAASIETAITDESKLLARLGQTKLDPGLGSAQTIGQLRMDLLLGSAILSMNYSRETLMATSALIAKNIQMSQVSAMATQPLPYRTQIAGSFVRKFFSDGNTGNDIQATLQYRFKFSLPQLSVSYAYRYSDYDHPAGNAYFDPQSFVSNQLTLNGIWELGPAYFYLVLNYGNQSFSRKNVDLGSHFVGYGTATVGWNISRRWTTEINAEWSNSASLERPAVYSDTTLSGRIGYTF